MDYTGPMLELTLLLLVCIVLLPGLIFRSLLGLLWFAEMLVIGGCHVMLALLAGWSCCAGWIGSAWSHRRPPHHPAG
ncbi:hypothetical protein ABWL39_20535 [Chitinivorax sp. PXF-14]|uniref:hypothetical protein n=1 Tax=Chitinivorax sp. PXF-14 TaxID=3230488 RepID=UPI00346674C5